MYICIYSKLHDRCCERFVCPRRYMTTAYYGTTEYYGSDTTALLRQRFAIPGASNDLQVRLEIDDSDNFKINEVGFRFEETN